MKTGQEQIEEIVKILVETSKKCRYTDCNNCDYQYVKDCAQYRKALALVQAGYSDVTEYKAEIERLKDKSEELRNEKWNAQDDFDCYCDEMPNKIKQAKIDVLNELKKKTHNYYPSIDSYCISQHVVLVRDIDELVAEVQND